MIMNSKIDLYAETPILFQYGRPSAEMLAELKTHSDLTILSESTALCLNQTYFKAGHEGCSDLTFTRKAVAVRLKMALNILQPHFGIIVLDAYRSIQAQRALFDHMAFGIKKEHPNWTEAQVFQETRKYMVNPDEKARFAIPPHNSGGAIDLALQVGGKMIEFGSEFDDPSIISSTHFFERNFDSSFNINPSDWKKYRTNRRILYHTMAGLGFTNYRAEWWHYDLGDCIWAAEFKLPWIFESLEPQVNSYSRV